MLHCLDGTNKPLVPFDTAKVFELAQGLYDAGFTDTSIFLHLFEGWTIPVRSAKGVNLFPQENVVRFKVDDHEVCSK